MSAAVLSRSASATALAIDVGVSPQYGFVALVADTRTRFEQRAIDALDRGERLLVTDLRGVRYIDSAGLGALVKITKRAAQTGARFVLLEPNDDIATLFTLMRLDVVLTIRTARERIAEGVAL